MQNYIKWKCSPKNGDRIFSSTEIAKNFGLSAQLLNKFLVYEGILIPDKTAYKNYKLSDASLGEECHYNTSHKYDTSANNNTTNITIKFSKLGKNYIEHLLSDKYGLVSKCDINVNYDDLEKYFPVGKYALSIRKAGTRYNPSPDAPTKIYVSYRENRNDSQFNRYYMFISDEDAKNIINDIKKWNKQNHLNSYYKMNVDNSYISSKIISWKEKYFKDILTSAGYCMQLTEKQIEENKKILNKLIANTKGVIL